MKANYSIYIEDDKLDKLKIESVKQRRPVSEIVRELIDDYLKKS